jgi:hypothetical protein
MESRADDDITLNVTLADLGFGEDKKLDEEGAVKLWEQSKKRIDAYTLICDKALRRSDPVFLQENLITITEVLMKAGHEDDIKALLNKIEACTQSDNPKLKAAAISSIPLFLKIKNSVRNPEVIERSVRARELIIEALISFGFEPRNLINAWVNSCWNGSSYISEIPLHEQPVIFRNHLAGIFQKNISN